MERVRYYTPVTPDSEGLLAVELQGGSGADIPQEQSLTAAFIYNDSPEGEPPFYIFKVFGRTGESKGLFNADSDVFTDGFGLAVDIHLEFKRVADGAYAHSRGQRELRLVFGDKGAMTFEDKSPAISRSHAINLQPGVLP